MSTDDWDPISTVIGSVLGGAIAAPLAPVLGPLAPVIGGIIGGNAFGHGDAPQAPHAAPPAPPPPGGTPPPPPAPGPLPPPPAGPAPGSGEAADKGNADANTVADVIAQLHELDKSAAETIDAIHAAGTAGQQQLDNIGKDVDDKITELGPRLDTPAGQQELRDFLKEKLSAAKKVLDQQIADADAKARHTRELTEKYGGIGAGSDGTTEPAANSGGGSGGAGDSGAGGGASPADQGTTPAAAAPAAAAPPAAGASPFGQGMMPGAGMLPAGMGMPSMPSLGGGGMPGLGGDPLSALSGLGGGQGGGGRDAGFRDDQDSGDQPKSDSSDSKFHDDASSGSEAGKPGPEDAQTAPAAADTPPATAAGEAAGDHTSTDPAVAQPPATTHVALPDGESVEARTVQGATAVKAAVGGATVADAWHQAGVNVPPPGTPVTTPIPPTQLQAGDVGVWQDHLVMALGNGKVLVSGQVQPLSSVGSSPDFLGWMDPSAQTAKVAQPAPVAAPVPPVPPPAPSSS